MVTEEIFVSATWCAYAKKISDILYALNVVIKFIPSLATLSKDGGKDIFCTLSFKPKNAIIDKTIFNDHSGSINQKLLPLFVF